MTSAATATATYWQALTSYLQQWFYKADSEALACILATTASHYYLDSPPVWLFVVGPSSSGKTRICIDSLDGLSHIWPMGDITSKTFISGNRDYAGLLSDIKEHGILTFKDFTTILSKREEERGEIAAQLREIYDGKFTKRTGMSTGQVWRGKITVIAGATTALERAWAIKRELGERFLVVRWPTTCDYAGLRLAAKQRGRDPEISKLLQQHIVGIVHNRASLLPQLPDGLAETIAAYSQILARLRGQIFRNPAGDITDQPVVEDSYRIHKQLCTVAASHAALWHRDPDERDLAIAKRLALDSIPLNRRLIFNCLLPLAPVTITEIATATGLPDSTAAYYLADLVTLKAVQQIAESNRVTNRFRTDFIEDLKLAGLV